MAGYAIITAFHGPTERHGARISARTIDAKIVRDVDHSLGIAERHAAVAMELANKLGWHGEWHISELHTHRSGYVFTRSRASIKATMTDNDVAVMAPEEL